VSEAFYRHPTALVESSDIGPHTRIWAFAHVMRGVRIGREVNVGDHCFIETGVSIGDGVTIKNGVMLWEGVRVENFVFIGPGVVFTNDRNPRSPRFPPVAERYRGKRWLSLTVVEESASIGANATLLSGITIGRFALVSAGAVVTGDVPAHGLAMGVPARVVGYVSDTGRRLKFSKTGEARCPETGRRYRLRRGKILYVD